MILNKKSINIVVAIQLVSAQITFNPKNFLIIAFCGYIRVRKATPFRGLFHLETQ